VHIEENFKKRKDEAGTKTINNPPMLIGSKLLGD
jgi:hypothetical protein